MNPDQILGFIAGLLVATAIFMACNRPEKPALVELCPHGRDQDYCPNCRNGRY